MSEQYTHRNGETDYPAVAGAYWQVHPVSGEMRPSIIDERDIEFARYVNALPQTRNKIGGYFRYYGPIPKPKVDEP